MSSSEDSDVVEDYFGINPDFEDLKKKRSQSADCKELVKIEILSTSSRASFVWNYFGRLMFKSKKIFDDKVL
jgi:hypothetical protein